MLNILVDLRTTEEGLARLRERGDCDVRLVPDPVETGPRPLPADMLAGRQALLCTFPPENLGDLTDLQWIQIASTGYSQLFGLGLPDRGIRACNASGAFDVPIAEWNIAMMVNLARDLRGMIRNQDQAVWDRSARFQQEIRGRTVGFWGYGGIGRETARLAKAFGLRVHVLERAVPGARTGFYTVEGTSDPEGSLPDRVFLPDRKEDFLKGLDFLVLSMPLTKQTEGIVGPAELRALPKHAFLLNPARGQLVQEKALLQALTEGWIAGAAIDTHFAYPLPPEHPLWAMPNVILTPHISGSSLSPHFLTRLWDIFCINVDRWQQGQPLLNELRPDQLRGQ